MYMQVNKNVNRTLTGNRGHGKNKRNCVIFTNIRTSKSTYYLLYDKSHSKTHTTITVYIPISILLKNFALPAKKQENSFYFKTGGNRNRLKK